MDLHSLVELLERIEAPDAKSFRAGEMGDGFFVQLEYEEEDVVEGGMAVQRGRKWYVSRHATTSEVVQTCLAACLASAEHQVREHFKYRALGEVRGRAIFGPHFHSDVLYGICGVRANYDAREPQPS
jgi:hypothetical protein